MTSPIHSFKSIYTIIAQISQSDISLSDKMTANATGSSNQCLISNRPIDAARPLKVVYIGAGVSGIIAAIKFLKAVPNLELVIYEKNPEVGGTWFENRYPGCACGMGLLLLVELLSFELTLHDRLTDIPSHAYQLSFESSTSWSSFYAGAPEILQYWKGVAAKHDVRKRMHFNRKCLGAEWDETRSKWKIQLEKLDEEGQIFEDESDVFMTGTGLLNQWSWPNIPGIHDFDGDLLHTANWNESFDATVSMITIGGA